MYFFTRLYRSSALRWTFIASVVVSLTWINIIGCDEVDFGENGFQKGTCYYHGWPVVYMFRSGAFVAQISFSEILHKPIGPLVWDSSAMKSIFFWRLGFNVLMSMLLVLATNAVMKAIASERIRYSLKSFFFIWTLAAAVYIAQMSASPIARSPVFFIVFLSELCAIVWCVQAVSKLKGTGVN